MPKQGSQEALPPLLCQHSYYKNKTKFLILQVHQLPEQGNPQHRVSVTQMHENLKEQTESEQHKKTLHQDLKI